jgi:hypothetical protein
MGTLVAIVAGFLFISAAGYLGLRSVKSSD